MGLRLAPGLMHGKKLSPGLASCRNSHAKMLPRAIILDGGRRGVGVGVDRHRLLGGKPEKVATKAPAIHLYREVINEP